MASLEDIHNDEIQPEGEDPVWTHDPKNGGLLLGSANIDWLYLEIQVKCQSE